jgi:hypothetical protein
MGRLLGRGSIKAKEFGAVVGLMSFEHGVESMQEFAYNGDQGLHFEFALSKQMLIEGASAGRAGRRLAQSEALRLESGRNSNELIHAQEG